VVRGREEGGVVRGREELGGVRGREEGGGVPPSSPATHAQGTYISLSMSISMYVYFDRVRPHTLVA
jgi:hypothetical protein